MAVYVDDMGLGADVQNGARVVRGKWSHMFADTHDELMAMARKIGLSPSWIQHPGTHREHFDVTASRRAAAVNAGAKQISYPRGTAELMAARRARQESAGQATS